MNRSFHKQIIEVSMYNQNQTNKNRQSQTNKQVGLNINSKILPKQQKILKSLIIMINQISLNSNNTIELSRGDLLAWVNDLLNTSITKIQQLGTGAHYCQMLDLLYPGKVQLGKVNFKAKNDYEYINNFKILQQYFTKFGILKNIEVEKLIKCKYQDNLEFLQWFKKIFDNHFAKSDSDASMRRSVSDNEPSISLQKQNKKPSRALNFDVPDSNKNGINEILKLQFSKQTSHKPSHTATSRPKNDGMKRQNSLLKPSTQRNNSFEVKVDLSLQNVQTEEMGLPRSGIKPKQVQDSQKKEPYYSPSKFIEKQNFYKITTDNQGFCNEEREFYLKKFREIQHLVEFYENNQNCQKLVGQLRKIILMGPQISDWTINEQSGEVVCGKQPDCTGPHDIVQFQSFLEPQAPSVQNQ